MKKPLFNKLLIVSLLIFVQSSRLFSQDITGLWKGVLYSDSTKTYLPYELAVSEVKGGLEGYAQVIFNVTGKEEFGLKRVKIKKKDDKIIIEDVEMIENNYDQPVPKGIKWLAVVSFSQNDTAMFLTGRWSTNRTKKYLPNVGTIQLQRKNDFKPTALFKKLIEKKLTSDLSFVEPQPKPVFEPKEPIKEDKPQRVIAAKPVKKTEPTLKEDKPKKAVVSKQEKKPEPVVTAAAIKVAAAEIATRKITSTQSVFYKSDSLVLTLYDNGEVDGDTVSVLMNGELIFAKQGLTTKANSKTIHITQATPDSLMLVMYAENLGSIPPNTGLLVIHDGEAIYELRFTADLQSNAAIILRRKKPGQ